MSNMKRLIEDVCVAVKESLDKGHSLDKAIILVASKMNLDAQYVSDIYEIYGDLL